MFKLILFLGICSTFALGRKLAVANEKCEKIVGCSYFGIHEWQKSTPNIDNIYMSLCTHVYYQYAHINADASIAISTPKDKQFKHNGLNRFRHLRKRNPNLKTLVTLEVSYEGSKRSTNQKVWTDPNLREKLVNNIVYFLKKYNFNGIDFFWEYKAQGHGGRDNVNSEKQNFLLTIKALREKFDREDLILSLIVGNRDETTKISYDIKEISKYVNFINLRTYDFHHTLNPIKKVAHNTALFHSSKENSKYRKLNIDHVVKYWIEHAAPPCKLILTTVFYGTLYTLADPQKAGVGAPITGVSQSISYKDTCPMISNKKWTHFVDKEQQVPYIYNGNKIIAYDDAESMKKKAQYAKKMNLGGVVVLDIDQDDLNGNCGGGKFPLLKTWNHVLTGES